MKDYTDVVIFCRCSVRMHTRGKHFQQYEHSPKRRKCPNCGKMRKLMIAKKEKEGDGDK